MSEKIFLDLWGEWGEPDEISEGEQINEFLMQLIDKSKGLFILDHFSFVNFDYVSSISYDKPFLKVYWQNFNEYREKWLNKKINDEELTTWSLFNYRTYSYMLLDVNKVKFVKVKEHLFILFRTNFIPEKRAKNYLLGQNNELISEENIKELLYKNYKFYEGNKGLQIIHDCYVNNLPYYSFLIQPKENNFAQSVSKKILLRYTMMEIAERMLSVRSSLSKIGQYDYDDLYAQGNIIRRILEYSLKFLCIYKDLDVKGEIEKKYGVYLRDLRKIIITNYEDIKFEQNIINKANELSHDSGVTYEKEEVELFWAQVKELIETVIKKVLDEK